MSETETNKSEEPSSFKLHKAREKGQVARGTDLGFFSSLVGLTLFVIIAGPNMFSGLTLMMVRTYASSIEGASDPAKLFSAFSISFNPAFQPILGFCAVILIVVITIEIIQLRGLVFATQALKPDFSRMNPGKGLKRVFSMRTLKETLKSVIKLLLYATAAGLVTISATKIFAQSITDASTLSRAMYQEGLRLTIVFACLAFVVAIIDQIIARQEFTKQMRMSRSELTRESKEREGDPRQKQKRKQLHDEFASQSKALGSLQGSDLLIVNPEHVAIGLKYHADTMAAPQVTTKGRNHFALLLKRKAALSAIPIFEAPALARALFASCSIGSDVPQEHYRGVADIYLKLHASRAPAQDTHHD